MANCDDFEIIDETDSVDDSVFELVDTNGDQERHATPKISDLVLPFLIPTPFVEETSPIVEQQTFIPIVEQQTFTPIVNIPEPASPVKTTISNTSFVPIKPTIIHPPLVPRIFAPVPSLPKAPPLRRYGNAASIPHHIDVSLDINTIIDKSRENQQNILQLSIQQQQDIQTVLDQRRQLSNKKNF